MRLRGKVRSVGFYPHLFLTHNDWTFWGKISRQIKIRKPGSFAINLACLMLMQ